MAWTKGRHYSHFAGRKSSRVSALDTATNHMDLLRVLRWKTWLYVVGNQSLTDHKVTGLAQSQRTDVNGYHNAQWPRHRILACSSTGSYLHGIARDIVSVVCSRRPQGRCFAGEGSKGIIA